MSKKTQEAIYLGGHQDLRESVTERQYEGIFEQFPVNMKINNQNAILGDPEVAQLPLLHYLAKARWLCGKVSLHVPLEYRLGFGKMWETHVNVFHTPAYFTFRSGRRESETTLGEWILLGLCFSDNQNQDILGNLQGISFSKEMRPNI